MHQWAFGNHKKKSKIKKLIEQTFFNKYTNFIPELQRIVTPESTICKKSKIYIRKTKQNEVKIIYKLDLQHPMSFGV